VHGYDSLTEINLLENKIIFPFYEVPTWALLYCSKNIFYKSVHWMQRKIRP